MGIIPLKIPRERSTVGSAPHREIRGIKRRLEQLMAPRGFQSVSGNYGAREMALL